MGQIAPLVECVATERMEIVVVQCDIYGTDSIYGKTVMGSKTATAGKAWMVAYMGCCIKVACFSVWCVEDESRLNRQNNQWEGSC